MNQILSDKIESKIVLINGQKLEVFSDGRIMRFNKNNEPRIVQNTNNNDGYNLIGCNGKNIRRHRIIAFTFLGLDISNLKLQIDHRNGDRLFNAVSNLRIVNHQQNHFNRTAAKGYYLHKTTQKWCAQIRLNDKLIHIGLFDTEEEARAAYLDAKQIHHIIL
jgi:hypothetical protein